jgi:hypothetical protein
VTEALLVIVPALIALVAGVVVALVQARRNLETQYDIDLRKERIGAYQNLWACFEPLAFYSPPGPVTFQTVRDISRTMREWYFTKGGLFLSTETRDVYFRLQRELTKTAHSRAVRTDDELDFDRREHIKALTSRLRSQMTEDVKTRVGSRLGGSLRARLKQRRDAPRHGVTVTVRQGVHWDPEEAESYVVTVQNHSWQREVVLESASIEASPEVNVSNDYRPLPLELPAQENWIGRVPISRVTSASAKDGPCVIATLASREQARGCFEGAAGSPAHHRS